MTKICMEALAKEGPLDTRQLVLRVIRAKELSESDKILAQTVALWVVQTLRMRARRGKVESSTQTKDVCVWRIPQGLGVTQTTRLLRISPGSGRRVVCAVRQINTETEYRYAKPNNKETAVFNLCVMHPRRMTRR
jgi:hypothetical protein